MLFNRPHFQPGDKVESLVFHPPEIKSGTKATIISPWISTLYAVQLPDGELHRWFADFELQSTNNKNNRTLQFGDTARVTENKGHPPMIQPGMVVKIVKTLPNTLFYDLKLENGMYHRWLADFEIIPQL